jgi:hypothetical protein
MGMLREQAPALRQNVQSPAQALYFWVARDVSPYESWAALANKRISLTTYHIYDKIILENLSHLYTFRIFLHL